MKIARRLVVIVFKLTRIAKGHGSSYEPMKSWLRLLNCKRRFTSSRWACSC